MNRCRMVAARMDERVKATLLYTPRDTARVRIALLAGLERKMVGRIFASWNHLERWLRGVDSLRSAT